MSNEVAFPAAAVVAVAASEGFAGRMLGKVLLELAAAGEGAQTAGPGAGKVLCLQNMVRQGLEED